MGAPPDAYWDDLGVAWRAINPDLSSIAPRLKARLRWQGICILGIVIVGIPLSIGGLALGALTIGMGWDKGVGILGIKGIVVVAISCLLWFASWSLRVGIRADAESLSDMLDFGIARAEKVRRAVLLASCACAVAGLFGSGGYVIRSHTSPPHMVSPIAPLMGLLLVALFLYYRHVGDDLARFRHLKHALREGDKDA